MSILKKFLKNKKGGFALQDENYHPLEKPLMHDKVYEYHHEKAVLEDEKLYDTESAKKVFTYESSLEYITLCRAKRRAYFTTPHGNWFSAEEEVDLMLITADSYRENGDLQKAISVYEQALRLSPENPEIIELLDEEDDEEEQAETYSDDEQEETDSKKNDKQKNKKSNEFIEDDFSKYFSK